MADALIALHFQNDICHPDGAIPFSLKRNTPEAEAFLAASRNALATARRKGWVIAHVHMGFAEDYSDLPRHAPLFRKARDFNAVRRGTWGAAPYAGFEPQAGEIVVSRPRNSAFHGTGLEEMLRDRGVDTLYMMGLATQFSVELTVRAASDIDFRTVVLADCCASADMDAHRASLKAMGMLADVVTSDTIG